jgi:hypothetical protein
MCFFFLLTYKNRESTFVKHGKKKIKYKSNSDKIIFNTFKTLNTQFLKKNCLISVSNAVFSIFLKKTYIE